VLAQGEHFSKASCYERARRLSETRPGTPVEVRKVPAYLDGPECVINTPESEGLAGDELERSGMSGGLDDKFDEVEDENVGIYVLIELSSQAYIYAVGSYRTNSLQVCLSPAGYRDTLDTATYLWCDTRSGGTNNANREVRVFRAIWSKT